MEAICYTSPGRIHTNAEYIWRRTGTVNMQESCVNVVHQLWYELRA
jgi:hypothetical protein